jgi:DUF4097 and DUF4098 domain-containing protein YvlB
MSSYPPPYPPPPNPGSWREHQRLMREQAKAIRSQARVQARAQRDAYRFHMQSLRRGSLAGPILLIGLGVVFLLVQTGHLPALAFWDWYGRWWPLLLIGVGTVVLLEWVIDFAFHDRDRPFVRRGIGGGTIALVLLLVLGGIAVNGMHSGHRFLTHNFNLNPDDLDQFLGDKHESEQTLVQPLPPGGTFEVDNPRGDITVTGTSDDNQVHVVLHKEIYTRSDADAATKAQQLTSGILANGNNVQLRVFAMEGAHADVTVTVPASAAQTIIANQGNVHVSAIKAPVTVTANHGDIDISAITGSVTAHIHNGDSSFSVHSVTGPVSLEGRGGDITASDVNGPVQIEGDFFGSTHLERVRGNVRFHTSRTNFQLARLDGDADISSDEDLSVHQAVGPVVLDTRDRNISLDRVSGGLAVSNRNGSVDVTSAPPLGDIIIQNRNGSIHLTLPDNAGFNVHAETTDGSISNDFSLPSADTHHANVISGDVGRGGPTLRITTSQGDISLKKANLAPLPPLPPSPPPITSRPGGLGGLDISDGDGSRVYIGKDGVKIIDGGDGSKVIIGKDGVNIRDGSGGPSVYEAPSGTRLEENPDGTLIYRAPNGTQLTRNADHTLVYISHNGTHYTKNADGTVVYTEANGIHITTTADGHANGTGPSGNSLNESQIRDQLRTIEQEIQRTEQQIEALRRQRDAAHTRASH